METFVFEGVEVRKTGRIASREIKTLKSSKTITIVEITPVSEHDGWKKWVNPSELYRVEQ